MIQAARLVRLQFCFPCRILVTISTWCAVSGGKCIRIACQDDVASGACSLGSISLQDLGVCVSDRIVNQAAEAQKMGMEMRGFVTSLTDLVCQSLFQDQCDLGKALNPAGGRRGMMCDDVRLCDAV